MVDREPINLSFDSAPGRDFGSFNIDEVTVMNRALETFIRNVETQGDKELERGAGLLECNFMRMVEREARQDTDYARSLSDTLRESPDRRDRMLAVYVLEQLHFALSERQILTEPRSEAAKWESLARTDDDFSVRDHATGALGRLISGVNRITTDETLELQTFVIALRDIEGWSTILPQDEY